MYKDKDKQKEANRGRQRRYRALRKGVTESRRDSKGVTLDMKPGGGNLGPAIKETLSNGSVVLEDKPANFGQPNCECKHCQSVRSNKSHNVLNHGPHKPASELSLNELNRVALPGDVDYRGAYQG